MFYLQIDVLSTCGMFVKGREHWEHRTEALFKEESVSIGHPPLGWLCGTSSDPEVALVLLLLGHELSCQILHLMGSVSRTCWWILYLMLNPMFWVSAPYIPLPAKQSPLDIPHLTCPKPMAHPLKCSTDLGGSLYSTTKTGTVNPIFLPVHIQPVTIPISSLSELSLDEMFSLHLPHYPATAKPSPYHISPGL